MKRGREIPRITGNAQVEKILTEDVFITVTYVQNTDFIIEF